MRGRRGTLRWIAGGGLALAVAGATFLGVSPAGAAAPKPSYTAGTDNATFSVTGVLDGNCPVSVGGTEVWIKPGDKIDFDSSLVGINVAKLPLHIGALAGLNIRATIDTAVVGAKTKHPVTIKVAGANTTAYPSAKQSALSAGDHALTWTATGVPLVGGLLTLPISPDAIAGQAGASLSWTGVIHVTSDAPKCKIGVATPITKLKLGPVSVTVPSIQPSIPGLTLPKLPSLGSLAPPKSTKPAAGSGGAAGGATSKSPGGSIVQPGLSVPQQVMGLGGSGAIYGSGGDGTIASNNGGLGDFAPLGGTGAFTPLTGPTSKKSGASTTPSSKSKTVDVASSSKPASSGGELPIILAILAIIALSLVAATYSRLYLLRRNV